MNPKDMSNEELVRYLKAAVALGYGAGGTDYGFELKRVSHSEEEIEKVLMRRFDEAESWYDAIRKLCGTDEEE